MSELNFSSSQINLDLRAKSYDKFAQYNLNNNFDIKAPQVSQQTATQKAGEIDNKKVAEQGVKPADWQNSAKQALNDSIYGPKPDISSAKTQDSEFSLGQDYEAPMGQPKAISAEPPKVKSKEQFMAMANLELAARLESGTSNLSIQMKSAALSSPSAVDTATKEKALRSVGVINNNNNTDINKITEEPKIVNPNRSINEMIKENLALEEKRTQFQQAKATVMQQFETE